GEGQLTFHPALDCQVLVARQLAADQDRLADDRVVAGPASQVLLGHGSARLLVHVDVALEGGPVGDEDARGLDVADHAALALQLHLVRGRDVAGDPAGDLHVLRLDVRLDDAGALHVQGLLEGDLPLHGALDDQVLVAGDLTIDHDARTNDRIRHVVLDPSPNLESLKPVKPRRGLDVVRQLDVHLHGPVEHRAVLDDHPGRLDVARHLGGGVDRHPGGGVDVPGRLAVDGELFGADVRLDLPGALDGEVVLEGDLPLHPPLDHQVPTAGEVALDDDALADDARLLVLRHTRKPLQTKLLRRYFRDARRSSRQRPAR